MQALFYALVNCGGEQAGQEWSTEECSSLNEREVPKQCNIMPQMPSLVRLLVKETEKMVAFLFKAEEDDGAGGYLDEPVTHKNCEHGCGNLIRYGLSSMQGWRSQMEDAHTAVPVIPNGLAEWSFFAVYDGHAGSKVAKYCSEHLLNHIISNEYFMKRQCCEDQQSVENIKIGIRKGFLQIDSRMHTLCRLDGWDRSGSTAVAVMISPKHIYFINCGDSRAMLSRNSEVYFYTEDHKPFNPREKERIQNAGGTVTLQRINGSLAVSRALGDFDFKSVDWRSQTEQLVSPEPEVYDIVRSEDDEFIILACDGIWDTINNEDLRRFVHSRLQLTNDLEDVCSQVIDTCLYKGSRDNMSIILVCFPGAPKVSEEAIQREAELDAFLETRIAEIFSENREEPLEFSYVIRYLASEWIPNLPPGGGIASKRAVIRNAYDRNKAERGMQVKSFNSEDGF
ncbi:protein phosphatase 1A-like [Protopterus annectens]|uniref:protein phosphatase 1A-like n=1 Tax=Protopterus annectens TaxID=7888 RepID=UPI001CFACA47|nr:protein phosphatase 1A-like [Protopterus annectens]